MRKRIIALFLILLLAASLLPASLAESGTPEEDTSSLDAEQFGEGAVVERDENGEPISVNGCPVRKVRAGINLRSNREAFQYNVWFTEYPFLQPATQYDGNLAVMSLAMALSANRAIDPGEEPSADFDPSLHLEKYLSEIGMPCVYRWEHELLQYALREMATLRGVTMIGTALDKASAFAFKVDGYSDEEIGKRLDEFGIAVRTGHHCAQPVLRRFGYESAVRPTLALYNSPDDIDALVKALRSFI